MPQETPSAPRRIGGGVDVQLPAWAVFAITFTAYLLMARLGLLLAIQPSNASPLFPAAGVGLAAAFVWGRWAVAAVAAAALAANLWHVSASTTLSAAVVATWIGTSAGAALQAAVGAWLVRRFVSMPLLLSEPADLARFMLMVTPLACLTSASMAVLVLLAGGTIGAAAAPATWGAWWIGDTLGVLIGAPIVWAFIAPPRDAWAPRRWAVALPLAIATTVMGLGIAESIRGEEERMQRAFQRDADNATHVMTSQLQEPLRALEAMRGLAEAAPDLDQETFGRAALPWTLAAPGIAALGLSERVERADVAAYEARQRVAGLAGYRAVERWPDGSAPAADDPLVLIRYIEPMAANAAALGVNARSVARARSAIDRATLTGRPVATAAFTLSQGGRGVVIYQALYRGDPQTPEQRARASRGVVFATVRPEQWLVALRDRLPSTLGICLIDNDAEPGARVLAGPDGCDKIEAPARLHTASLPLASRQWDLRVTASASAAGPRGMGRTWPLALVSLASASMLGALLLTITGRARRIEAAVVDRTAELQQRSTELQAEAAQRQRTAMALRESQQRLRSILDHAPIGVAYTDTEGRIREANPYLRELLGTTSERLAGMPMARLLHADDRQTEAQARARLLEGDVPMARANLRCKASDGRIIATRASVSVLRSAKNNEPRRMVWVIEDITEHLALEEANRAREGAEAANLAKSEFLSRMSHELRTPLNALLGFTQLLELDRKQALAPHQLDWTAQMRQAGWHLLHMINDTLDLSRIESGHVELEPRTLDLTELVAAAQALVQQAADKRHIRVEVHLGLGAHAVIGDATRVKQILTNLLSNAVKYNIDGGSVIVASRMADEGRVALDVIDTGAGMSPQQLAQLFQPFNRLGQESGPVEGTGIGLVISLRLAELMGGTLHVKSSIGMGSTFTLELPRAAVAPAPSLNDDDAVEPAAYRRRVIHYVEDNETNAEVMRGILALRPQVELEISTLGLDGLAAIKRRRPSLVLLDMQLPDIDGLELLRHLQAGADTADIPVIVVSADATEARISQAIAAGATHYLTKPVNVPSFLAALDSVLDQLDTHFG